MAKEAKELIKAISTLHEERERVTQEALDAWEKIEDFIMEKFDRGTIIRVSSDIVLKVAKIYTNVGGYETILFGSKEYYGEYDWKEIPTKTSSFGKGYYLHGNFNYWMQFADRDFTLRILQNARLILEKVKEKLENQVEQAKRAKEEVVKGESIL